MAPQYRYGSYCGEMLCEYVNREMICQDHVTVNLDHRLLGLGERRLLNEAAVPTVCAHNEKSGAEGSVSVIKWMDRSRTQWVKNSFCFAHPRR